MTSSSIRLEPVDVTGLKPGDVVKRIWGYGWMETEMRVVSVDDGFVYCDAQRPIGVEEWSFEIPNSEDPWKFDIVFGVETDEKQGWGVKDGLVLSRIVPNER